MKSAILLAGVGRVLAGFRDQNGWVSVFFLRSNSDWRLLMAVLVSPALANGIFRFHDVKERKDLAKSTSQTNISLHR